MKITKILGVLLALCFLMSVTTTAVSADMRTPQVAGNINQLREKPTVTELNKGSKGPVFNGGPENPVLNKGLKGSGFIKSPEGPEKLRRPSLKKHYSFDENHHKMFFEEREEYGEYHKYHHLAHWEKHKEGHREFYRDCGCWKTVYVDKMVFVKEYWSDENF